MPDLIAFTELSAATKKTPYESEVKAYPTGGGSLKVGESWFWAEIQHDAMTAAGTKQTLKIADLWLC